jgi:23S rRNA (uridine2479-2'-O)-methyltransferase
MKADIGRSPDARKGHRLAAALKVTVRNATFQRWEALLTNRTKRHRQQEFLVQGVRPITLAVEQGWQIREVLSDDRPQLSPWADAIWRSTGGKRYVVSADLMAELGEKPEGRPELLAVVRMPPDDLARIPVPPDALAAVFDRPTNPGNIGTLIRSLDAFGGCGLLVTGHATDPYDPRCVRASTGSIFAVPVVRVPSHREVLSWVADVRGRGVPLTVVGTDEAGDTDIADFDLTGPTLVVVGNETVGMTAAWREACDHVLRIPMAGTASSLNAASAGTVLFYEALRQRAAARGGAPRNA